MGYKLADGSDSDLYRSGDTFHYVISVGQFVAGKTVLTAHDQTFIPDEGGKITLSLNGIDSYVGEISELIPTEETRRKLAERSKTPADAYREFDKQCKKILSDIFADKAFPVFPVDEPEPLARIIDWRGGEPHKPTDISVNDNGDTATMLSIHQSIGKLGWNTIIRINTAAIPKLRTMTRIEVEREFGVKVVD